MKWYGQGLMKALTGNIDFDTDTFKVMVCTSTYVPNQDTHVFRSDVTNEVAPSGTYAAGGISLGAATVTYDGASNEIRITWGSVSATGATITGRVAVIYKARGGAASADELVGYFVEAADVVAVNGTYTVTLPGPTLTVIPGT
jgi:hypothetical protein